MRDDLYQLLDVAPSASQEELKAAYRRQAMKYHPDRNGGNSAAEERFKAVVEAYRILGDPQEREAYALLERLTGVPTADADAAPSHRGCCGGAADSSGIRALGWSPQHTFADFVTRHCHA